MAVRRLAFILGLSLLGLSALRAATPVMGLDEVRPGMIGTGRTVFDGTHVEEFKARVIGVITNVIGPQRSLILARLEGGPLANTGVIAGMSGSPIGGSAIAAATVSGSLAVDMGALLRASPNPR